MDGPEETEVDKVEVEEESVRIFSLLVMLFVVSIVHVLLLNRRCVRRHGGLESRGKLQRVVTTPDFQEVDHPQGGEKQEYTW